MCIIARGVAKEAMIQTICQSTDLIDDNRIILCLEMSLQLLLISSVDQHVHNLH